jgi:hypothetical protein
MRAGFDVTRVDPGRYNQPATVNDYAQQAARTMGQTGYSFGPDTAAQFIMQRNDQQRDEESSRLRLMRVISIGLGLVIAYYLQIDALQLLAEAFPGALENLNLMVVSGDALNSLRTWLPSDKSITVGIILTAFAASAGSAFWHDRLDQLQAAKRSAQAAAEALGQAREVSDSVESGRR